MTAQKTKPMRDWLSFSSKAERDRLNWEWWNSLAPRQRQELTQQLLERARIESGWRPASQSSALDEEMFQL